MTGHGLGTGSEVAVAKYQNLVFVNQTTVNHGLSQFYPNDLGILGTLLKQKSLPF